MEFETPKALANRSPGLDRSDNPGNLNNKRRNPERVRLGEEPFQGLIFILITSQGCRCAPNPGLQLANAFGVNLNKEHKKSLPSATDVHRAIADGEFEVGTTSAGAGTDRALGEAGFLA